MKPWIRRLIVLAALVAVAVLLRLTVFAPDPVPVSVFAVDRGRVESTVVNSRAGTVHSRDEAELSPGLSGVVREIPVAKGDRVVQGQVLLRLDDAEYAAQVVLAQRAVDAARSAENEARVTADQADRELTRNEGLFGKGFVSDSVIENVRMKRDVAIASQAAARDRVKQADASLAVARATLSKTVLAAPFDGVVADIQAEEGEWISPSMPGLMIPPVIEMVDPGNLYVRAPIDEVDVAKARLGLPVRITMDTFSGRSFPGLVSWIAPKVDAREEQNRVLQVEATFDAGADLSRVLPGLSADIEIILEARDDVLRIPSYALLEGGKVLVVKGETLAERTVELGLQNWSFAEVRSGLEAEDEVVVSLDRAEVKEGARVRVTSGSQP